jgi:hypothetical protein
LAKGGVSGGSAEAGNLWLVEVDSIFSTGLGVRAPSLAYDRSFA